MKLFKTFNPRIKSVIYALLVLFLIYYVPSIILDFKPKDRGITVKNIDSIIWSKNSSLVTLDITGKGSVIDNKIEITTLQGNFLVKLKVLKKINNLDINESANSIRVITKIVDNIIVEVYQFKGNKVESILNQEEVKRKQRYILK